MENFTEADVLKINDLAMGRGQSAPPATAAAEPATEKPNDTTTTTDKTPAPATPAPDKTAEKTEASPAVSFDYGKYGVKDETELTSRLSKVSEYERSISELNKQLEQLNEYKAGPKFNSDRQKYLYEFAKKSEGMELQAAQQLLNVIALDLPNLPDQQARFEAFRLDPQNRGLSQDEMVKLFAHTENNLYGDPTNTENPPSDVQKILAKQATAKARESLSKMQSEWNSTRTVEKTPVELANEKAQYNQFIKDQVSGFEGIPAITLSGVDEKGEKLDGSINFKIDNAKQLPVIEAAIQDPSGWWDKKLVDLGVLAGDGKTIDYKKFAAFVSRIEFNDQLLSGAYQQGLSDAIAKKLNASRNLQDPSNGTRQAPPPEPPKKSEKDDAIAGAMKVAGLV